jgi:hypothetical protein
MRQVQREQQHSACVCAAPGVQPILQQRSVSAALLLVAGGFHMYGVACCSCCVLAGLRPAAGLTQSMARHSFASDLASAGVLGLALGCCSNSTSTHRTIMVEHKNLL